MFKLFHKDVTMELKNGLNAIAKFALFIVFDYFCPSQGCAFLG